jgi:hypothetical protein
MFQLTAEEFGDLKSQFATSSATYGGRRSLPYAFTEHGAIMAATVLNSQRAVKMSVFVVRAFVQLREMRSAHRELAVKRDALERKVGSHDQAIAGLIDAVSQRSLDKRSAVRGANISGALRRKIYDRWTALRLSRLRGKATLAVFPMIDRGFQGV